MNWTKCTDEQPEYERLCLAWTGELFRLAYTMVIHGEHVWIMLHVAPKGYNIIHPTHWTYLYPPIDEVITATVEVGDE